MTASNDPRQWGLAGYLLSGFSAFAGLMAVPLFLVTMAIAFLIDRIGTLEQSIWEWASLLVRFYALAIVLHVVKTHFPLHLAHGGTRRQFLGQLTLFVVAHGAVLAGLTTLGFWLESMVSNLAGWSTPTSSYAYFDSGTDVVAVASTFMVLFVVWGAATALGAVSRYRHRDAGGLGVVAGVLMVMAVESSFGDGFLFLGFIGRFVTLDQWSIGVSVAIGVALALLATFVTWLVGRNLNVKNPAEM